MDPCFIPVSADIGEYKITTNGNLFLERIRSISEQSRQHNKTTRISQLLKQNKIPTILLPDSGILHFGNVRTVLDNSFVEWVHSDNLGIVCNLKYPKLVDIIKHPVKILFQSITRKIKNEEAVISSINNTVWDLNIWESLRKEPKDAIHIKYPGSEKQSWASNVTTIEINRQGNNIVFCCSFWDHIMNILLQ